MDDTKTKIEKKLPQSKKAFCLVQYKNKWTKSWFSVMMVLTGKNFINLNNQLT